MQNSLKVVFYTRSLGTDLKAFYMNSFTWNKSLVLIPSDSISFPVLINIKEIRE
jgi:hypothetical protein